VRSSHAQRQRGPHAALALAVLAVLAFLAGAGTAASAHAGGAQGTNRFGLTPSSEGRPRPYFNLIVSPGHLVHDTAIIANQESRTQRLKISISRGVTATNSGSAYQNTTGTCTGASCWVTGLPPTVTLPPRARKVLTFDVAVPANTTPAQYLTGITAEPADRPSPVKVGSNGQASAKAIIVGQITVGVAVTVGSLSHMKTALTVSPVSAGWIGRTPRLSIPVNNPGQTFARAKGTITCSRGGTHHTYGVIMQTVLPGGSAALPINAPGLDSGSAQCTVHLHDGTGHAIVWSGIVNLPSRTQTKIIHTGDGAYTALPDNTVPPWAIALMAIGTLILAALLALLTLRHRQRRPSTVRLAEETQQPRTRTRLLRAMTAGRLPRN
jgi:WxL Interacting Protein, peptidoglycan binding domain